MDVQSFSGWIRYLMVVNLGLFQRMYNIYAELIALFSHLYVFEFETWCHSTTILGTLSFFALFQCRTRLQLTENRDFLEVTSRRCIRYSLNSLFLLFYLRLKFRWSSFFLASHFEASIYGFLSHIFFCYFILCVQIFPEHLTRWNFLLMGFGTLHKVSVMTRNGRPLV